MKAVIEDFKQREKDQKNVLEKLKDKDRRIRELTKEVANLNAKEDNSGELSKLRKENDYLKEQQSKVSFFAINIALQKIDSVEGKFTEMYHEYKRAVEENAKLKLEADEL